MITAGVVLLFVADQQVGAAPAQTVPRCTFENPFSGAPLTIPSGGIGVGMKCDGPGVVTFAISAPTGALEGGLGGISWELGADYSPMTGYFTSGTPAGAWWVISEDSSECVIAPGGEGSEFTFGTTCDTPPAVGADIIATLHFDAPIAAVIGNSAGESFTVTDATPGEYEPPPTTTTSSTTSSTTTSTTTTTVAPEPDWSEGSDGQYRVGVAVALVLLVFGTFFRIGATS